MLVLTRRVGERILIGDNISLVVLDSPNLSRVRLGIEAPASVHILREELLERLSPETVSKPVGNRSTSILGKTIVKFKGR